MTKRRVILVDDHALFRGGLRGLLERYADVEVVGEASDGDEFLAMIETTPADIVFMDISMERISGDVATEQALARFPGLKIITLSMFGDEYYYSRMVRAGAKGFLLKNSDIKEVVAAIESVSDGGDYFSQELLESLRTTMHDNTNTEQLNSDVLSSRESEILVGVCQGLSNQEIAEKLFISKRTVDKHRANIMEKTGCKNTANLVVYAIRNHLVKFH
ncbi:MAG: response regulator transcription factor [Rikenellaceae bacterium]